jgi:hypothetical protein
MYTTFGGGGGLTKAFNRLELTAKGDVERTVYQDSLLTEGTTASNDDRQQRRPPVQSIQRRVPRGLWDASWCEAVRRVGCRKPDLAVDSFGYQRDSNGVSVKAASSFDLRGTLTGEFAIG